MGTAVAVPTWCIEWCVDYSAGSAGRVAAAASTHALTSSTTGTFKPSLYFLLMSRRSWKSLPGRSSLPSASTPDFVNASPTRNCSAHKPQREYNILTTSRKGMGALFNSILIVSPEQK